MKPFLPYLRAKAGEIVSSRFARQSGWMVASSVASMVFGFVFWRVAGSGVLGVFALVQRAVEFVCNLDLLLDEALTRALIEYREPEDRGKGLWVIQVCYALDLLLGIAVFLLVWFWVAPAAPAVFRDMLAGSRLDAGAFTRLIRIYSVAMLLGTVGSSSIGILQAYRRFGSMAALFAVDALLKMVLPLAAWWGGLGLEGVLGAFVVQAAVYNAALCAMAWRLVRTEYRGVRPRFLGRQEGRALLKFALTVTLSRVPKEMLRDLDTLILGTCATDVQVGWYHGAKSYGSKLGFFAGPVGSVLFPRLAQHAAEGNWKRFKSDVLRLAKWMAALSVPTLAVMLLAAPPLMAFVREDYRAILPTMVWILLASLLTNLTCFIRPGIMAVGKPGISIWTNVIMLSVLVAGALVLGPRLHHLGIAQAWFLAHLVGVAAGAWLLRRAVLQASAAPGAPV